MKLNGKSIESVQFSSIDLRNSCLSSPCTSISASTTPFNDQKTRLIVSLILALHKVVDERPSDRIDQGMTMIYARQSGMLELAFVNRRGHL